MPDIYGKSFDSTAVLGLGADVGVGAGVDVCGGGGVGVDVRAGVRACACVCLCSGARTGDKGRGETFHAQYCTFMITPRINIVFCPAG
jgi:hypothetical protein